MSFFSNIPSPHRSESYDINYLRQRYPSTTASSNPSFSFSNNINNLSSTPLSTPFSTPLSLNPSSPEEEILTLSTPQRPQNLTFSSEQSPNSSTDSISRYELEEGIYNNVCPITLKNLTHIHPNRRFTLHCGHAYVKTALQDLFKSNYRLRERGERYENCKCPTCREPIQEVEEVKIFDEEEVEIYRLPAQVQRTFSTRFLPNPFPPTPIPLSSSSTNPSAASATTVIPPTATVAAPQVPRSRSRSRPRHLLSNYPPTVPNTSSSTTASFSRTATYDRSFLNEHHSVGLFSSILPSLEKISTVFGASLFASIFIHFKRMFLTPVQISLILFLLVSLIIHTITIVMTFSMNSLFTLTYPFNHFSAVLLLMNILFVGVVGIMYGVVKCCFFEIYQLLGLPLPDQITPNTSKWDIFVTSLSQFFNWIYSSN